MDAEMTAEQSPLRTTTCLREEEMQRAEGLGIWQTGHTKLSGDSVTSSSLLKTLPCLQPCFHFFAAISVWEMLTPQPHSSVYWHAELQLFAGILLLLHHLALCAYAWYSKFSLRWESLSRDSNIHHASEPLTCLFLQCQCHKILPSKLPWQ